MQNVDRKENRYERKKNIYIYLERERERERGRESAMKVESWTTGKR